jgi:hypothetical protein
MPVRQSRHDRLLRRATYEQDYVHYKYATQVFQIRNYLRIIDFAINLQKFCRSHAARRGIFEASEVFVSLGPEVDSKRPVIEIPKLNSEHDLSLSRIAYSPQLAVRIHNLFICFQKELCYV